MLFKKSKDGFCYKMSEEDAKKTHTIPTPHTVTNQELEDILVGSLEGDIGYWAVLDNTTDVWHNKPKDLPISQYALEILLNGGSIKFEDAEGSDDDSNWILTLDKLLKGIGLNKKERTWDCDLNDMDSETCDCIIQYALFGEVVYG